MGQRLVNAGEGDTNTHTEEGDDIPFGIALGESPRAS